MSTASGGMPGNTSTERRSSASPGAWPSSAARILTSGCVWGNLTGLRCRARGAIGSATSHRRAKNPCGGTTRGLQSSRLRSLRSGMGKTSASPDQLCQSAQDTDTLGDRIFLLRSQIADNHEMVKHLKRTGEELERELHAL